MCMDEFATLRIHSEGDQNEQMNNLKTFEKHAFVFSEIWNVQYNPTTEHIKVNGEKIKLTDEKLMVTLWSCSIGRLG